MIAVIGIMIGFYIITRVLSFMSRKNDRQESTIVLILSFVTFVVCFLGIIYLIFSGFSGNSPTGFNSPFLK